MLAVKVKAIALMEFGRLVHSRVFQLSLVLVPLFTVGLGYLSTRFEQAGPPPVGGSLGPASALVPVASMVLLFLMVMLTTPQMMSSVIEEKMSRISEVLLASVSAFDLMAGKLLACCGAAALVGAIYLPLGLLLAWSFGYGALVSPLALLYLALFFVLAVLLHGSMYMAVGAACSEPKDAQGMLAPLVLLTSIPLITVRTLLQDPASSLARGLSFFPLSAPFVMCFRLNCSPPPRAAEVGLSVGITLAAALGCVWVASRIFRVGLLAMGKPPSLGELWAWVFVDRS